MRLKYIGKDKLAAAAPEDILEVYFYSSNDSIVVIYRKDTNNLDLRWTHIYDSFSDFAKDWEEVR